MVEGSGPLLRLQGGVQLGRSSGRKDRLQDHAQALQVALCQADPRHAQVAVQIGDHVPQSIVGGLRAGRPAGRSILMTRAPMSCSRNVA